MSIHRSVLHPDTRQIVKLMRELDVSLADNDWKQLIELIDAAVRHASETGYRRGKREHIRLATPKRTAKTFNSKGTP